MLKGYRLVAVLFAVLLTAAALVDCSNLTQILDDNVPLSGDVPSAFAEDDFDLRHIQSGLGKAKKACEPVLEDLSLASGGYYYDLAQADYDTMAEHISALGYPVAGDSLRDMAHHEQVLDFWDKLRRGEPAAVTVYELHSTMVVAETLVTRGGRVGFLPVYEEFATPDDSPDEVYRTVGDVEQVDEITLTEKGYLLFRYLDADGNEWRQGYRVEPLGEELRRLTAYAPPLDTAGNNLAAVDWDRGSLEALHLPDVFFWLARGGLPAEAALEDYRSDDAYALPGHLFEGVLIGHLPVSAGYLRASCPYDEEQALYRLDTATGSRCPPEPEVVACETNADGTLLLTVDYVAIPRGDDRVATSQLLVQETPGGIRYIRNRMLEP